MKKFLNILSKCVVWLIVVLTVCVMIFTIISVNTFDRNDRQLFGFKAFIVLSDSMKATDFAAGDVVLVKSVDPITLQEGDIIAYTSQDPDSYGETITHKIRCLTTDANGEPGFITYGTTTDTDDAIVVTYPYILGKYQFRLPQVGTFFQFLKTTQGYIVCILIPFLLLILYQGLNCVRVFRQYKAEQMAEIQAEREKIEQERRKSDAMMEELMALKAQLASQQAQPGNGPGQEDGSAEQNGSQTAATGQNVGDKEG